MATSRKSPIGSENSPVFTSEAPSSPPASGGSTMPSVPLVTVTDETGTRTVTTSGHCLSMDSADLKELKSGDKRKWFQSKWFSATTTKDRREKFKRRTVSLETEAPPKDGASGKGKGKDGKGWTSGFFHRNSASESLESGSTDKLHNVSSPTSAAGPSVPPPATEVKSMRSRRPISRLSSVWSEVVSNSVVGGGDESDFSDINEEDEKEATNESGAAARWRIIRDRIGEVIFFGDRDLDYEYEPHPNSVTSGGPRQQRMGREALMSPHAYQSGTRRLSGPFPVTTKGRRHQAFMTRSLDTSRDTFSQPYNEGNITLPCCLEKERKKK